MINTIVIGAGVMGASVAYRLAQAGAAVTVLEATRVGGGTSGISFAWTNAHKKPPKVYHDLNVAGMKAHAALADEFGATPWWHGGRQSGMGSRTRSLGAAQQRRAAAFLGLCGGVDHTAPSAGIGARCRSRDDRRRACGIFPGRGLARPVVYAHAMLSAARLRHGAKVICGARVVDLIMAGDRVTGVRVADGTRYEADTVVNCAGRWTNETTRDAGLHLPLAPTVGFLVFTPPVATSLSRVVRTPVIQVRPDGARRLMLHWNPTDATLSFDPRLSPSTPEARDLVRRARQLLPSIGEVEPEAVRIAIRPIPGDQLSAIGPMPRTSVYYIAITHSGVTMSPFLGAVVADEIVRGRQRAALAHFQPARFFN